MPGSIRPGSMHGAVRAFRLPQRLFAGCAWRYRVTDRSIRVRKIKTDLVKNAWIDCVALLLARYNPGLLEAAARHRFQQVFDQPFTPGISSRKIGGTKCVSPQNIDCNSRVAGKIDDVSFMGEPIRLGGGSQVAKIGRRTDIDAQRFLSTVRGDPGVLRPEWRNLTLWKISGIGDHHHHRNYSRDADLPGI